MVSLGDTAISLHILQRPPGRVCSAKGQTWNRGRKLEFGNFWGVFCQRSDLNSGKKIGVWKFLGGGFCQRSDLNFGKKIGVRKFGGGGGCSAKGQI